MQVILAVEVLKIVDLFELLWHVDLVARTLLVQPTIVRILGWA